MQSEPTIVKKKMPVGILIDNGQISPEIADFIKLSENNDFFYISHFISQSVKIYHGNLILKIYQFVRKRGLIRLLEQQTFTLLKKIEKILLRDRIISVFEIADLKPEHLGIPIIKVNPMISKSGFVYTYTELDIDKVRTSNASLLVRGGSGILKGAILTCLPHGILSFHHGDNNVNRGGPPAFWETYLRQSKLGFIIQRLTNELDGGEVLYRGFISTHQFYSLNELRLFKYANPILVKVLEDIASGCTNFIQAEVPKPYFYPLYKIPSLNIQARYMFQNFKDVFLNRLKALTNTKSEWHIHYLYSDHWENAVLWRSKCIPNPRGRYLADPFVIEKQDKHYIFCEDYDCKQRQGRISVIEVTPDGWSHLGVALEEEFHLSYPYIFWCNERLLMCPDTHEINEIRLYECTEFPLKWRLLEVLIKDINAVDTNIFYQDDRWWLLTNVSSQSPNYHESELHIFYSSTLISGTWSSHKSNPVVFNSDIARNAGMLAKGGSRYRVRQRQGFAKYGESLTVAKIQYLGADAFIEGEVFSVTSNFNSVNEGIHTFNYDRGLLVFDVLRPSD